MTSSPAATPETCNAKWVAAVQELTAIAYLTPIYSPNRCSNSLVLGPVLNQREAKTSLSAAISGPSAPIQGRLKGISFLLAVMLVPAPLFFRKRQGMSRYIVLATNLYRPTVFVDPTELNLDGMFG